MQLKHLTSLLNKASEDEMKEDDEEEDDDEKEKKKDKADDSQLKRPDYSNVGGTRSAKQISNDLQEMVAAADFKRKNDAS